MSAPSSEAGVPPEVAGLLAAAMTRHHTVTFACGTAPSRVLDPSATQRLGGHRSIGIASVTLPEPAAALFSDDIFQWCLGAQFALLTPRTAPPAELTYSMARGLLDHRLPSTADLAQIAWGLLSPGVDGDFAGFAGFHRDARAAFEQSLADSCLTAGVPLDILAEDEFKRTDWFGVNA